MRSKPYYSRNKIVSLIKKGQVHVTDNALRTAEEDFGWKLEDIKSALLKLKPKHFHKSEPRYDNPSIWVDYYKAPKIMGENVYTHFYIVEDKLIVDSFKEL